MTPKAYNYAVLIGRFQPFHLGHLHVFEKALTQAEHLIILVGSSGGPRSIRNPFTFTERQTIIRTSLPSAFDNKTTLRPLLDFTYDDDKWTQAVQSQIDEIAGKQKSIVLIGHDKDETTYYLALFPHWAYIEVSNLNGSNATSIRQDYLASTAPEGFSSHLLTRSVNHFLQSFAKTEHYRYLQQSYQAIEDFKASWQRTPYPVSFITTDALVRHSSDILLIRRKNHPFKGYLALPGGFLDATETLLDGCLRELAEGTHLAIDAKDLSNCLVTHATFDKPNRDPRGRIITCAYYFNISHLAKKPSIQADDATDSVAWIDYKTLQRCDVAADHFFIIQYLLKTSGHE